MQSITMKHKKKTTRIILGINYLYKYFVCACFFIISKNISQIAMKYVINNDKTNFNWFPYSSLIAPLLMLLCDFLSGFLIKKNIIAHATIIVLLAAAVTYHHLRDYDLYIKILCMATFLGGIGGGGSYLIKRQFLKH